MKTRQRPVIAAAAISVLFLSALPLRAQQGNGSLKAHVDPGRAGVFVDGKYLGPASNFKRARTYSLTPGEHEVALVDPRFEEYTTKVTIRAGQTTSISQNLKALPMPSPPFGGLRTTGGSDKFAAVYINTHFMGHVDEFSNPAQDLQLKPGEYTVRIVPTGGGAAYEEKVTIVADKTTVVTVK